MAAPTPSEHAALKAQVAVATAGDGGGLILFFQASWFSGKWTPSETKVIFQGPNFPLKYDYGRKGRCGDVIFL